MRTWLLVIVSLILWTNGHAESAAVKLAGEAPELLEAWVNAQNSGDFAAYAKLYHRAFSGVQGSGKLAVRLNRAQWLAERRATFGKDKIGVEKPHLQASSTEVRLHVTVLRRTGKSQELTRNVLVLAREGKALRIFGEGTLAILGREKDRLRQFAFVLGRRVVLNAAPRDEWAGGREQAERRPQEHSVRVTRAVARGKLPPELAAWAGQRVRLLGPQGARCQAKIATLELVGRVDGMESDTPEDQWASSSQLLVGVLAADKKACAGATWARAASLAVPRVHPARPPEPGLKSATLAAFRALPEHKRVQAEYLRWRGRQKGTKRSGVWDEADGSPTVVVIRGESPAVTLVSVSSQAWISEQGGCRDTFESALWGLWEVEKAGAGAGAGPKLLLRSRPNAGVSLVPTAGSDVDGDGQLELLFRSFVDQTRPNAAGQSLGMDVGIIHSRGGYYDDLEGLSVPVLICPC